MHTISYLSAADLNNFFLELSIDLFAYREHILPFVKH